MDDNKVQSPLFSKDESKFPKGWDGLLKLGRKPTDNEMKKHFKKFDFSAMKIHFKRKRTNDEIEYKKYVSDIANQIFEETAKSKGRISSGKYYNDEDNPLMVMQANFNDIVSDAVTELVTNHKDKVTDIFQALNSKKPITEESADELLRKAYDKALDVTGFTDVIKIIKENSDERDFNQNMPNNYRAADHDRRWNHTDTKTEVYGCENIEDEADEDILAFDEETTDKIFIMDFINILSDNDKMILTYKLEGYSQEEIAEMVGYSNNSAVSKRLKIIGEKYNQFKNDYVKS